MTNEIPLDPGAKNQSRSAWGRTPVANLIRYKPSGIYFARLGIRGKLFRHSLKPDVISAAKPRIRSLCSNSEEDQPNPAARKAIEP